MPHCGFQTNKQRVISRFFISSAINIFQGSYYKYGYCITITLLLAAVSTSYCLILHKERKTRNNVGNDVGINREMTVKILLIIGTQLISWISFIGATIYYDLNEGVPDLIFEIFATVVIPINSVLNPIFYSEIYKTTLMNMKAMMKNCFNVESQQNVIHLDELQPKEK